MSEFLDISTAAKALDSLWQHLSPNAQSERVPTSEACGRVAATELTAPEDLPSFPKSAMDGFSVRAKDTFGATDTLPSYLEVIGEIPMGKAPEITLREGQAARSYTGGMLAVGADAVVMVENSHQVSRNDIEISRPVAPGENVLQTAEDIREGEKILPKGHILRPQDIGGLLALGIMDIEVAKRPHVSIISSGDELLSPAEKPNPGQIRDINSYTISALVQKTGGIPNIAPLVSDDLKNQLNAARIGLATNDVLVFSAGSSVSEHDRTSAVINSLGTPGVIAHGISVKPGKPTIVAVVDGKPVFGLPGNPVSAMVVFDLVVRPTLYRLLGCNTPPDTASVDATLMRNIPSVTGREDYVQIRLLRQGRVLCADPVFGKSNLIYTLIRSDGMVKIPLDSGGLYAGEKVSVTLY